MQRNDIKIIVFDLDGTLYDLRDVYPMQYAMQIEYLCTFLGIEEDEAIEMLNQQGISDEPSPDSASATALFYAIGIDNSDWNRYREKNFDINEILRTRAADPAILEEFATIAKLVLLTRTGYKIIYEILEHLNIRRNLFDLIICPETEGFAQDVFSKTEAFRHIAKHYGVGYDGILSIGDRYHVDIEPLERLGGQGFVSTKPKHLKNILAELKK